MRKLLLEEYARNPFKWMSIFKSNPNHVKGRKLGRHGPIRVQMA